LVPLNVDGSRGLGFDLISVRFIKLAKIRGGQKVTPPTPKNRGGTPFFTVFPIEGDLGREGPQF
jgi:hypothetical protein